MRLAASASASLSGSTVAPEVKSHMVDTGAMVTSKAPSERSLTCRATSSMARVSSDTSTGVPPAWFRFHTSLPSMVRDSMRSYRPHSARASSSTAASST